jgi:hypothetical protein
MSAETDILHDANFQREIADKLAENEKAKLVDIAEAAQEVIKNSDLYEKGGKPCVLISYSAFKRLADALKERENG